MIEKHLKMQRNVKNANHALIPFGIGHLEQTDTDSYSLVTDPKEVTKRTDSGKRSLMANVREEMLLGKRIDQFQREYTDQVMTINHSEKSFKRDLNKLLNRQKNIHNNRLKTLKGLRTERNGAQIENETKQRRMAVGKPSDAWVSTRNEGTTNKEKEKLLTDLIQKQVHEHHKRKTHANKKRLLTKKYSEIREQHAIIEKEDLEGRVARFLAPDKEDIHPFSKGPMFDFMVPPNLQRSARSSNASLISYQSRPFSAPINDADNLSLPSRPGSAYSGKSAIGGSSSRTSSALSSASKIEDLHALNVKRPFYCKSPISKTPSAFFKGRASPKIYMCRSSRRTSNVSIH